jgi:cardiolipin synthase (CMP-forming)
MNLPNLITIGRILLVPLTVWLIISGEFLLAFFAFVAAGISDGVDGFIARRFNQRTELGAYLDPIADKALLVSIYVSLGLLKFLPAWLVILVVTRDVLIVGAFILSWVVGKPLVVAPSIASKFNTAGQIILAGVVLGFLGLDMGLMPFLDVGFISVAILTFGSGALYMKAWLRHMANGIQGDKT